VALDRLREEVDTYGPRAFLVTVGPGGGRAHVVSVLVRLDGGSLVAGAGRTSCANAASNPDVTLLWPPAVAEGPYSLIVDGHASVDGEATIRVEPTRAVLHRVAGVDDAVPNCVPLEAD
jgi:hypothetical protein